MGTRLRAVAGALVMIALALGVVVLATPTTTGAPGGQFCGGIAGIPCPEGFVCVDDPTDDCNPKRGGADCSGICRRQRP